MSSMVLGKNHIIVEKLGFFKTRKFYSPDYVAEKLGMTLYGLSTVLHDHDLVPHSTFDGVCWFTQNDLRTLNKLLYRGRVNFSFGGLL